jgi:hypothetical protein
MFDRLKTLPLTIVLTILIWMYAESQVNSKTIERLSVEGVPVLISGPPDVLSRYEVTVDSGTVSVELSGPQDQIAAVRQRPPGQSGIYAYLDITRDDQPAGSSTYRTLRFVTPDGTAVTQSPQVGFRLREIKKNLAPAGI